MPGADWPFRSEPDIKAAAPSLLRLQMNLSLHQLRESFADGQPKAGAAIFSGSGLIGLSERAEEHHLLCLGNPDTGVADADREPIAVVTS